MFDTILVCVSGALRWYAVALVLSLPSAPLFIAWLPPGIGWGVARCLGPQLICWAAILPSLFSQSTAFNPMRVAIAAVCVAVVSTVLAIAALKPVHGVKRNPQCSPVRSLLAFEALYLGLFIFLSAIVSWCSVVGASDAMTDAGIFIGILQQRVFPIQDPALAGFDLHYYIFGFYAKAAVAFFTGLGPLENYRIAIAATAAAQIAAIGIFLRAFSWSWVLSSAGALVLGFCSNFEAMLEFLRKIAFGSSYNAAPAIGWLDQDYSGGGFLISGFIGGALHSTILSYSIQPVFYALCALVLLAPAKEQSRRDWALAFIGAWMAAWAAGSNTWEVPMYLGLSVLCFLSTWRMRTWKQTALLLGSFLVLFVVASLPLRAIAHQAPLRFGWDHYTTPLTTLERNWAIFFLPFQAWLLRQLFTENWRRYIPSVLLAILAVVGNGGFAMILSLLVLCATEMASKNIRLRTCFVFGFIGFGMLAVLETVYLRNTTPGRFNTLTHVNPIVWNLLSVVGLVLVAAWCEKSARGKWAAVALGVVLLFPYHFAFSMKGRMLDFGSQDRHGGLSQIAGQSADDEELVRWIWREQAAGRLIPGVVLEASLQEYDSHLPARLTAPTGLLSYLGYSHHAYHLILYDEAPEILHRREFVQALREHTWPQIADRCALLRSTLQKEKIDYVAMGYVEREVYHPSFQRLVDGCLTPLHRGDFYSATKSL
jgi:uncharacterized membrane protein